MGPARAAKLSRLLLPGSDFLRRRSTGASKPSKKPVNDLAADCRCVACLTTFRRVCYCLCPPEPTRGKECSGQTAPGDRSPVIQEKDGRPIPTRSRRVHPTPRLRSPRGRPLPRLNRNRRGHRSSSRSPHTTRRLPSTKRGFVPFRSTISRRQPSSSAP